MTVSTITESGSRNFDLDAAKAIAVVLMIFSNTAIYFKNVDFPILFRFFCSLAAPIFLFCLGQNVSISLDKMARLSAFQTKKTKFIFFLKKSARVALVAVCVDLLIWGIVPFLSADILYIISFGILAIAFCGIYLSMRAFLFITFSILALSEILLAFTMYKSDFVYLDLSELSAPFDFYVRTILNNFFVEGWFPLFPWLFFVFFGFVFQKKNDCFEFLTKSHFRFILFASMVILYLIFFGNQVGMPKRFQNIEIFYPASFDFICISILVLLLMFNFLKSCNAKSRLRNLVFWLSKNSLMIYIINLFLVKIMISTKSLPDKGFGYLIAFIFVWIFCFLLINSFRFLPLSIKMFNR